MLFFNNFHRDENRNVSRSKIKVGGIIYWFKRRVTKIRYFFFFSLYVYQRDIQISPKLIKREIRVFGDFPNFLWNILWLWRPSQICQGCAVRLFQVQLQNCKIINLNFISYSNSPWNFDLFLKLITLHKKFWYRIIN